MLLAKAVIPNQFWILKQDDRKVGNIEVIPGGVQIRINNQVEQFKNIRSLKQRVKIDWQAAPRQARPVLTNAVYGYPTTSQPHNGIFNVKYQVPLWTKESRSKSWYAAGWYRIRHGRTWSVEQCPKLIVLERYEYQGPFHTEQEARS